MLQLERALFAHLALSRPPEPELHEAKSGCGCTRTLQWRKCQQRNAAATCGRDLRFVSIRNAAAFAIRRSLTRCPAILVMLGDELNLVPKDYKSKAKCAQLVLDAYDLFTELCVKKDKACMESWYAYFEKVLTTAGTGYLLNAKVTPADFTLFWVMLWMDARTVDNDAGPWAVEGPKLKAFRAKVEQLPVVKKLDQQAGCVRIPEMKLWA